MARRTQNSPQFASTTSESIAPERSLSHTVWLPCGRAMHAQWAHVFSRKILSLNRTSCLNSHTGNLLSLSLSLINYTRSLEKHVVASSYLILVYSLIYSQSSSTCASLVLIDNPALQSNNRLRCIIIVVPDIQSNRKCLNSFVSAQFFDKVATWMLSTMWPCRPSRIWPVSPRPERTPKTFDSVPMCVLRCWPAWTYWPMRSPLRWVRKVGDHHSESYRSTYFTDFVSKQKF